MKKSLSESKVIRFYLLLWGLFAAGLLVADIFGNNITQRRTIGVTGLVISFGSLLLTIFMLYPVQAEIKARYSIAVNGERIFLIGLFYWARGFFFLAGALILVSSLSRKDALSKNLVEVGGKISSIEVYGSDRSNLKIIFAGNSNEYETRTFEIPDEKLEQIENKLHPGNFVYILIGQEDEKAINDPYVQIYGIRTKDYDYLSLDEYNRADSTNNTIGMILGIVFAGLGIIYLSTGKIKNKPDDVLRIEQNTSEV